MPDTTAPDLPSTDHPDRARGTTPVRLGELEARQRDGSPPWGDALTAGVEVADVTLRAAGIRWARSPADLAADTEAWGAALAAAGVRAGSGCTVLLPSDGEGCRDDVLAALPQLGAQRHLPPAPPRAIIAEQRQLQATTLIASRTLLLGLQSTVYAEFPLEPADLGYERIVLIGEIATEREGRRISQEFGSDLAEIAVGPTGRPIGVRSARGPFAPVEGAIVRCWDGERYGAEGELVVTVPAAEAMPLVDLSSGRLGSVDDEGRFTVSGATAEGIGRVAHRLIATEAVARVVRVVPGVADWRLLITRPGREEILHLLIHASRDEHAHIARNAKRELAERLGLDAEVHVTVADPSAPYGNEVAHGELDAPKVEEH